MSRACTFILALLVTNQVWAGLELHSVRCSSKNLTLDLTFVADNQNVPGATVQEANAKGYFFFRSRDNRGTQILGGRTERAFEKLMGVETGLSTVLAYGKTDTKLIYTRDDLNSYLREAHPMIYLFEGKIVGENDKLEEINEIVSYLNGHKIKWQKCNFDWKSMMTIKKKFTIRSYPVQKLMDMLTCPRWGTERGYRLLETAGEEYIRTGDMDDYCLNKLLNENLDRRGKSTQSFKVDELKKIIGYMMAR
jgi:hypothetical protein